MTRARSLHHTLLCLPLALVCVLAFMAALPRFAFAADEGTITGIVTNVKTKERLADAIVILRCTCLQGEKETRSNENGLFAFQNLPPGEYTVEVFSNEASTEKTAKLPRGAKVRVDFAIDPENKFDVKITHETKIRTDTTASGMTLSMDEFRNVPIGGTGRDFTQVVEAAATAGRDSAGYTLGGTTGAETRYTVNGMSANNPAFGTVGISILQEFIEDVQVQEAGYEAEFGNAAGGQVSARRRSGTNKVRGVARFTFVPRLAKPRFIIATDNAVRATETMDFGMQGVVAVSGPLIKDRLFWSAGVGISGVRASLVQSFHSRVDKDGSGGYESCPYKNGDADCVDGGDYIATEKFAEQTFRTGGVNLNFSFGLDWAINPKHRLQASYFGSPEFTRRAFRRPVGFSLDPAGWGTSLNADPLGGAARVASGIVNDHFGWDRESAHIVGIGYLGRVLDDKLEIDAGLSFGQFHSQEAWRLDNPEHYRTPMTQETDGQGENLFKFLDREDNKDLVPGVKEACNDATLPGLACPTRQWLSGGLGTYGESYGRTYEGRVSFTHFFNAAGAHQLKYGTLIQHNEGRQISRISGSNADGFYDNCAGLGFSGGGEWCYDSGADTYRMFGDVNRANRVDNHRVVFINTDNPDSRQTVGYGRVRKEQDELRAIATPIGAGVRNREYNESYSTQNYALYLQDKWSVLSNLFISAGVRWEMQDMRDIMGDRAVFIWDNVAPRVGVVYDWTDEGKSRLYASYGWFYQPLPLQLNARVFGGLVDVYRTYRGADCVDSSVTVAGETYQKYDRGQPTEWCQDFNDFTTQLTEGAVVPRLKGQYNQQFQVGYEQEVIEDLILGVRWLHTDLGRAVEDISTNGGLNFIIANPGESVSRDDLRRQQETCDALSAELESLDDDDERYQQVARERNRCEFLADAFSKVGSMFNKPVRNYDAFTFEVKKRFARNWTVIGSYTYSRLIGNYDGFVDPITGAINLGGSVQYDIPELVRNSFGPLSYNTPHVAKLNGFYAFDLQEAGRLTIGTSFNFRSGYPISMRGGSSRYPGVYPIYVIPRGSGGRIEPTYNWNVQVGYAYPLRGQLELEVSARLINITNSKAVFRVDEVYTYQNTRPVAGGDLQDLKHAKVQSSSNPTDFFNRTVLSPQGNYGVESSFQLPFAASFDVMLRF